MRRKAQLFLTAAVLWLSGCAGGTFGGIVGGTAAIPEFLHYREAVRAQHEAGTRVLDRLAWAENRLLTLEGGAMTDGFDPNAAATVLGIGDPPRTAVLRRGLEALRAYNETLTASANGTPDRALATGLALMDAALAAGVAPPGVKFMRLADATLQVLPILRLMGSAGDAAQLRATLATATPQIRELLRAMRAATPAIYQVLSAAEVEPGNLEYLDGIPPAGRARLEADGQLLAGWVMLIDQTMVAVEVAAAAALSGDRADATALIDVAFRLTALAEAINARRTK